LAFSHALGQRFPAPQFRVCRAGLEPFASFGNNRFFKVADDFEGHPQLLSIFDKSKQYSGPQNIEPDSANAGA
jgi:hypothetical protein